jgi:hypothetical protein
LPAKRVQEFSTYEDNQTAVEIRAFIGERKLAQDNVQLSQIRLDDIPKMKRGEPKVEISFELDQELRLQVKATEKVSGKTITSSGSASEAITKERVQELLQDAEQNRVNDDAKVKRIQANNNAERTIHRAEEYLSKFPSSSARNEIEKLIAELGSALEAGTEATIVSKTGELEAKISSSYHDPFELFRQAFQQPTTPSAQSVPQPKPKQARVTPRREVRRSDALQKNNPASSTLGKIFGGLVSTPDPNLCFVLMPISGDFTPLYEDHLKKIIRKQSMTCVRADEVVSVGSITKDIWEKICSARFLVADLTGRNANVFYEVGLAHALGKDVILLTRSMNDVPFDLKSLRCIVYEFTPRGVAELETRLEKVIVDLIRSA